MCRLNYLKLTQLIWWCKNWLWGARRKYWISLKIQNQLKRQLLLHAHLQPHDKPLPCAVTNQNATYVCGKATSGDGGHSQQHADAGTGVARHSQSCETPQHCLCCSRFFWATTVRSPQGCRRRPSSSSFPHKWSPPTFLARDTPISLRLKVTTTTALEFEWVPPPLFCSTAIPSNSPQIQSPSSGPIFVLLLFLILVGWLINLVW